PRLPPAPFPSLPLALRTHVPRMHPQSAVVTDCDPASHSPSAAATPAARTPLAPCTPVSSLTDGFVVPPRLLCLRPARSHSGRCSKPPDASLQRCLRAQSLPLPSHPYAPPPPLRSPPVRSGIPESSLENRSALRILWSHPEATGPDPLCGTSVSLRSVRTDWAENALPSVPAGSDILAPLQLLRYTALRPLPQVPADAIRPGCRSECWQSASRSEFSPVWDRYLSRP